MRTLASLLVAVAAFALPASAASVDPRVFVLRQIDVPAHYEFDTENSLVLPAELAARNAEGRRVVVRAGYVNGYLASYLNTDSSRWKHIVSVAFVFRRAEGAKMYLAWLDKFTRESNAGQRSPVDIGAGGWMYVSRSRDTGTQVAWRSGRVVALVSCEWMTSHRSLALAMAPKQQRRIAAALR
jgi:hypothetical protein